ncbi:hypothetical protein B0H17DRAFT_1215374 [Mycena rosella]|uniref:CCHC-type domain-containing protein n=1 Tax=Mycena rosella TaxID=1033263 RepID=A0AAD7CHL4_MYCRO|nr:hypothetical protein B0H17DRAFT_1215374 [Mycena rosella]
MADANPKLFKGDGISENATDFLNAMRRRNLLSPSWKDVEKLEFFELCKKLMQWPEKMAEKEKGVRVENDGIQEWDHVCWALKVAELGARIDAAGSLISLALKNIPGSLLLRLGSKRGTWPELVQAMKDVPTAELTVVRHNEMRMAEMEARIAQLQQTPSRALAVSFANMAMSSPARNDPAAPVGCAPFCPDSERLRIIQATSAMIHPCTAAGLVAYVLQITVYNQKHSAQAGKPNEDRPYPLTPGTVNVTLGECHVCGMMGHFGTRCNAAENLKCPALETRWRQIAQSICSQAERKANPTTAINIVADGSDADVRECDVFFDTADYDQAVIEDYLRHEGKGSGPSI